MKNFLSFIWEIVKIVVIALVIVIPIRYFLFQPFFVKGQSMEPNFENGDYLLVDELSYKFREPQRGEVIVFKYPKDTSQRYIKRIIGLPGEIVEINGGQITVYSAAGTKLLNESGYLSQSEYTSGNLRTTLSGDEYFVLGDNRLASADSRRWGSLSQKDIIGRVFFRAFPFATLSCIEAPSY
jgi:signal peptidase I